MKLYYTMKGKIYIIHTFAKTAISDLRLTKNQGYSSASDDKNIAPEMGWGMLSRCC